MVGAREAAARLRRIADGLEGLDLSAGGREVRGEVAGLSPRRTGALAGSWDLERRGRIVTVGSALVYAPVLNYGGHGITARHFVERAAVTSAGRVVRLAAAEVDRLTQH